MGATLVAIDPGHDILVRIRDTSRCTFTNIGRPFTVVEMETGFCGLPSTHLGIGKNERVAGLCADHALHVSRCRRCVEFVQAAVPWEEIRPSLIDRLSSEKQLVRMLAAKAILAYRKLEEVA